MDEDDTALDAIMSGSPNPARNEGAEAATPPTEGEAESADGHAQALLSDIQAKLAELSALIPAA